MKAVLRSVAVMGFVVVASEGSAHPVSPTAPATDNVERLRCDYVLKIDRKLANGIPETAKQEKTNQLYEFDFTSGKLWRHGEQFAMQVSSAEVDFTIGAVKYQYDRTSMRLSGLSYESTPGGTSTVTIDGTCKNEVLGEFSPTATPQ